MVIRCSVSKNLGKTRELLLALAQKLCYIRQAMLRTLPSSVNWTAFYPHVVAFTLLIHAAPTKAFQVHTTSDLDVNVLCLCYFCLDMFWRRSTGHANPQQRLIKDGLSLQDLINACEMHLPSIICCIVHRRFEVHITGFSLPMKASNESEWDLKLPQVNRFQAHRPTF